VTCIEPGFVQSEMTDRSRGKVTMPFLATTEAAADKYCRAILRGTRKIAWPTVHAVGSVALSWLPRPLFRAVTMPSTRRQMAELEAELKASRERP
jgi:short-subunit dehydrogenase